MADWRGGLTNIPSHMHGAVERYIIHGIPPGSFLEAVICNDLKNAFGRADLENRRAMYHWADFMYNWMPSDAQGSRDKYEAWIAHGGIMGPQEHVAAQEPDNAADAF